VHAEYRMCIQHRCGRSLSSEGPGPKAFGSNVLDASFPEHFWVPNNINKYDGKTNPSIWLEDYRLTCRAGGADSNMFIIQFLPIYWVNTSRAWLDHLPRDSIGHPRALEHAL
jgi:hypothetical protein